MHLWCLTSTVPVSLFRLCMGYAHRKAPHEPILFSHVAQTQVTFVRDKHLPLVPQPVIDQLRISFCRDYMFVIESPVKVNASTTSCGLLHIIV